MTLTGRPALLVGTLTSSPAHLLQQRSASTGQVYDAQSSPKNSRMPFRMQVERLINSHIPRGKTDRLSRSVMRFLTDRGGKCLLDSLFSSVVSLNSTEPAVASASV